jgi:hypothetical protein
MCLNIHRLKKAHCSTNYYFKTVSGYWKGGKNFFPDGLKSPAEESDQELADCREIIAVVVA